MKRWPSHGRHLHASKLRPKTVFLVIVAMLAAYYLLFSGSDSNVQVVPYDPLRGSEGQDASGNQDIDDGSQMPVVRKELWELTAEYLDDWYDPTDDEDPNDVELGYETDGKERGFGALARLQHEKDMRKEWRHAYSVTENLPTSNLIYGNTLATLDRQDLRTDEFSSDLRYDPEADVEYSVEKPVRYDPYPSYNDLQWKEGGHAPYIPCTGANNDYMEDLLVFRGQPHEWPTPRFGSYDVMNMDGNLCWERETRLGPYGLTPQKKLGEHGKLENLDWNKVNWGDLQRACVHQNAQRYDMNKDRKNEYLSVYPETADPAADSKASEDPLLSQRDVPEEPADEKSATTGDAVKEAVKETIHNHNKKRTSLTGFVSETRTAVLLRSYTGKVYTDNDKQTIRALVSELSLRSGGEYEVFLLVQVKDNTIHIFEDSGAYQWVLQRWVPPEFHGITVLWNDGLVGDIYTAMKDPEERSVHTAQWLSVQKFSQDHPQFEYIWNWEMDFRFTGHHYELLEKMSSFAKKQPRKGLWERNERWYIPEFHGSYDTDFRQDIERRHGNNTVWGPVNLSFINPVGPKPPVPSPDDDNYEWGVGEEADVITVGPIFNPVGSNWVIADNIWGYNDGTFNPKDLPRRTTIVTQSRISKRLLKIMHVENLRGNHVASEMTPQTVALHHGLKAVFAPHPVFMDRAWDGQFLAKWFNPGEKGESGGRGSPMGWGRERRYIGTTWYYRALPPNRLFNNWMGWSDSGIGGVKWEEKHGRPCLPPMMLHHVKNTETTKGNHKTTFELTYG
ncbi:hypothetical protein G7Z17_g10866 [Cylindrodendrum hubeiense]|uniref:Major facilitator superfamily transporter n=1 Tax=Cylindrodendrum hubeiense TaxID=595255 RepID=A0A9P5L6W8_9HYPO|nr:hypothetical protein G7Z17_g10866 [Cylindrodendrum hubeiense]